MLKTLLSKKYIIVLIFVIFIFSLFSFIVLGSNIHGDAKFHTLYAKESSDNGDLVRSQPYRIYQFNGSERIYMPIAYPLTSESLFTVLYIFGGEALLKLYSPIFATIIFLLLFLCIKDLGYLKACFISALSTISISERLMMTPLMEPYMIICLLAGILFIKKFFLSDKSLYIYLAAVFLGSAASIKQQGLINLAVIICFIFIYFLYKVIFLKKPLLKTLIVFLFFTAISIALPFPAIRDQINRTGTFAFSPGTTNLPKSLPLAKYIQPLLTSSFDVNPNAIKARDKIIGYNKQKLSLVDKVNGFIQAPFLFYRSSNKSFQVQYIFLSTLILSITLLSYLLLERKNKNQFFWIFVLFIVITEVFTSFIIKTPITQYHSFGLLLSTTLIFWGAIKLLDISKIIGTSTTIILFVFFSIGYANFIFPLWSDFGREDDYHLIGYKRIGEFAKKNTPKESIFYAAETSFRYYAQRDIVWLNESIGGITTNVAYSSDDKDALLNLSKLNAEYIVINMDQIKRFGVNDYLPPNGLVSIINKSRYFTKIYDAYGDGKMTMYKINYDKKLQK